MVHLVCARRVKLWFKIISGLLKQKHTAKYKIFFVILWKAGLERIFLLSIFSGSIIRFKGRAFSLHRSLWLPEVCGKCLREGTERRKNAVIWCLLDMRF